MAESRKSCIYCLRVGGPWTDEHVLQKGFGTTGVLEDDVCGSCNAHFSAFDSKLIEFVREFAYLADPVRFISGKLGLMRDLESGAWLTVRVESGRPVVLPQLVFLPAGTIHFAIDPGSVSGNLASAQKEMGKILSELERPAELKLARTLAGIPESQPAIVRSRAFAYMLRSPTDRGIDALFSAIQNGTLTSAFSAGQANPPFVGQSREPVQVKITFDLGAIARALAKSALNFICKSLGPEVSRSAALNDLRNFVVNGSSTFDEFVTMLIGKEAEQAQRQPGFLHKTGRHAMLLLGSVTPPLVFVSLYGWPFAVVRIVGGASAIPRSTLVAVLFDHGTGMHQEIDARRDPLAFARMFLTR